MNVSSQVLQPEIAKRRDVVAASFELNRQNTMIDEHRRVIVDQYRHQVAVDEIQHRPAAGDQVNLIPVADFPVGLETIRITNGGEERRSLTIGRRRTNNLSA